MPLQRTRTQIISNAHAHAKRAHAHVINYLCTRAPSLHGKGALRHPPAPPARWARGAYSNKLTTILKYSGGHLIGGSFPRTPFKKQ